MVKTNVWLRTFNSCLIAQGIPWQLVQILLFNNIAAVYYIQERTN